MAPPAFVSGTRGWPLSRRGSAGRASARRPGLVIRPSPVARVGPTMSAATAGPLRRRAPPSLAARPRHASLPPPPPPPAPPLPRSIAAAVGALTPTTPDGAAYMATAATRVGFFLAGRLASAALVAATTHAAAPTASSPPHERPGALASLFYPGPVPTAPAFGWLAAAVAGLLAADAANIDARVYPRPPLTTRSPRHAASALASYVADAPAVAARQASNAVRDVPARVGAGGRGVDDGGVAYPNYYLRNFHHQTDGYLSTASAARYAVQVEMLFFGTADMMRRQGLVPLHAWATARAAGGGRTRGGGGSRLRLRPTPPRILNVPVGPGGVLPDLAAAHPASPIVNADISPYYLAQARATYTSTTAAAGRSPTARVSFVRAAAEALPFPDASFDAVLSVYLLHELPPAVRSAVFAEWARVLAPGGLVVVVDSVQAAEVAAGGLPLDPARFAASFHEPFYGTYQSTDFDALAAAHGLIPYDTRQAFLSKVMSWTKPSA